MKLEWDGRTWELQPKDLTLRQAMVITSRFGGTINDWSDALEQPNSLKWLTAVECLYWLMLAQDGQQVAIAETDFPVLRYAEAWADAYLQDSAPAGDEPDPTKLAGANGAAGSVPVPVTG